MGKDDEEKAFYEEYIKPQYKRVKTIKDIEILDYDFLMKLFCILMIYVLIRLVIVGILDIYRWFFPSKEYITQQPFFQELIFNA